MVVGKNYTNFHCSMCGIMIALKPVDIEITMNLDQTFINHGFTMLIN